MNYIRVLRGVMKEAEVNLVLLEIARKNHRIMATHYHWNKDDTFNCIITVNDEPKRQNKPPITP